MRLAWGVLQRPSPTRAHFARVGAGTGPAALASLSTVEERAPPGGCGRFAPQFRLGPDGNVILDEASLNVTAAGGRAGFEPMGTGVDDDGGAPITSCEATWQQLASRPGATR